MNTVDFISIMLESHKVEFNRRYIENVMRKGIRSRRGDLRPGQEIMTQWQAGNVPSLERRHKSRHN